MSKPIIVITGANGGIGFEAARHFAGAGARVIMACRSMDKAEKAQAEIHRDVENADTRVLRLDVSDLSSVRAFADQFKSEVGELDVLINNAGITDVPLMRNDADYEMQLATNYLGPFALTGLMLPFFPQERSTRVVNVGSLMHRLGKLDLDDLNWEKAEYDRWKAYGRSKIAMMSYTLELNRRLHDSGSRTIALSAHPGFANTNIRQHNPDAREPSTALGKWFRKKMEGLVPSAADAARPIILAASDPSVRGGDYYGPGGFLEIGGKPAKAKINRQAKDPELARRLWDISESITGVRYLSDTRSS